MVFPFSAFLTFFALGAFYKWQDIWLITHRLELSNQHTIIITPFRIMIKIKCTKYLFLFLKFVFLLLFARYQFYIRLSTKMFCEFSFCHQFHTFAGFFFSTGAGLAFCQTKKEDIYFKYSNGKLHNKRELQWKEDNCRWHWVHFSFVIISQNNSFALNFIHKKQQQCMRPVFLRSLPAPAALTIFFPIEIRGRKLSIRTAEITILHDPN